MTNNQESFCYCCHCWGEVETSDILTEEKELAGKKKVMKHLLTNSPCLLPEPCEVLLIEDLGNIMTFLT